MALHANEELYRERLRYWTDTLQDVGEAEAKKHEGAATSELDGFWRRRGYMGKQCFVSGEGCWMELVPDDEVEEDDVVLSYIPQVERAHVIRRGVVVARVATSLGFSVARFDAGIEAYNLSHCFDLGDIGIGNEFGTNILSSNLHIRVGTLSILRTGAIGRLVPPDAHRTAWQN